MRGKEQFIVTPGSMAASGFDGYHAARLLALLTMHGGKSGQRVSSIGRMATGKEEPPSASRA